MRYIALFMVLCPLSLSAQWERWQPWVADVGVTPYGELNFRGGTSDTLGKYKLNNTALDLLAGVQVVIPPFYARVGFGNFYNMLVMQNDTTFCPLFADWRIGFQLTYEEITTYDISISFIKSLADEDFMGILLELGYGRVVGELTFGEIQVLGDVGIGRLSCALTDPDKIKSERADMVLDLCIGGFLRMPYITPYLYCGISYPFAKETIEINPFIGIGIHAQLLGSYVKAIPTVAYPKIFMGPKKKE